jgi:hypothetical protein
LLILRRLLLVDRFSYTWRASLVMKVVVLFISSTGPHSFSLVVAANPATSHLSGSGGCAMWSVQRLRESTQSVMRGFKAEELLRS